MRFVATLVAALALTPGAALAVSLPRAFPHTDVFLFRYRAHDGVLRRAWLLLPTGYAGGRIPLVISPHGRGTSARANERLWGDLPGLGGFAVVNPAGEGRRLGLYSWGDPGQISDLARMPAIVRAQGVNVDPHRIYAIGGSMGGQETLILLARHPRLLAGAAAFDPATDMVRRYRDFAGLPDGLTLQRLARDEIGGTPMTDRAAYEVRSPDTYVRQIARSRVPLLLYWSTRDRVISDQVVETGALAAAIRDRNPHMPLEVFRGRWRHTAEMRWSRRLPGALVRLGLLRRGQAIQI